MHYTRTPSPKFIIKSISIFKSRHHFVVRESTFPSKQNNFHLETLDWKEYLGRPESEAKTIDKFQKGRICFSDPSSTSPFF